MLFVVVPQVFSAKAAIIATTIALQLSGAALAVIALVAIIAVIVLGLVVIGLSS